MAVLVLLRSGQNRWDQDCRFTGWYDADITTQGAAEAREAGAALLAADILPDVVHTSLQTRAIKTANLAQREMDRLWIPVRRHWRLNERHFGVLTGLTSAEAVEQYGDEQVDRWRHGYDTPPPEMPADHPDNPRSDRRYANLPPQVLPTTESPAQVSDRVLSYWFDEIIPDLGVFDTVMIAAHGDSLRALVRHLSNMGNDEVGHLSLPTAEPLIYQVDVHGRPATDTAIDNRYLR
ncbi:MAG: 2,3-bisphosphoglycerate-dependent phosphoglycerate mutase [Acidimicrobiia bacterium]|nr:2,3-bisphosphoglycerate-dependent phosphoglycerate mutase [Acidimicrobiia bacterium]